MPSRTDSLRTCNHLLAAAIVFVVFGLSGCAEGGPPPSPESPPEPEPFSVTVLDAAPASDLPTPFAIPEGLSPEQEWLNVGPVAARGGRTATIHVTVPPGAQSLTVYVRGHDGTLLLLDEAVGPDRQVLVSPVWPLTDAERQFSGARGFPSQFFSPTRQVARATEAIARLPLRDDTSLTPGLWSIRLRSARVGRPGAALDRPLQVALLLDSEPVSDEDQVPPSEQLHLAFHFVGTSLRAEDALDDTAFAQMTDALKTIFASASVEVEIASLHDEPAFDPALSLDSSLGCSGGDLDTLFSSGAQSESGALDVYFVERFRCVNAAGIDVGAFISGLSGGIPAAVFSRNSSRGGIAVAVDSEGTPDGFATETLAELVAHEIGHALGLFHVMEITAPPDPMVFDIIADTVDDEGAIQSNLMFPRINGRTRLSDGQGQVLRQHPGVRQ